MAGFFLRLLALTLSLVALIVPTACCVGAEPFQEGVTFSDVEEGMSDTPIIVDSPDFVYKLLEVAGGEIGYVEGPNNFSKYGQWSGDENAAWCAEFVCWCVDQVDKLYGTALLNATYPNYSGRNTGRDWYIARGRFVNRKGNIPGWGYQWLRGETSYMKKNDYIPRPGDLVFFSYNEAGDTEHVALVEFSAISPGGAVIIHVIEGNNPSSVQRNTYYLNNSQVLGFGVCEDMVETTMRFGNSGDKVLRLQKDLNYLGILAERHLTGTYGSNTKRAVMDVQRGMEDKNANGVADIRTQLEIARMVERKRDSTPETWLVSD